MDTQSAAPSHLGGKVFDPPAGFLCFVSNPFSTQAPKDTRTGLPAGAQQEPRAGRYLPVLLLHADDRRAPSPCSLPGAPYVEPGASAVAKESLKSLAEGSHAHAAGSLPSLQRGETSTPPAAMVSRVERSGSYSSSLKTWGSSLGTVMTVRHSA